VKEEKFDAKYITGKLDEALELFGTYNYYDKGVDEVMSTTLIVDKLTNLSAKECGEILVEVKKHKHGEHLVNYLVGGMDNMPTTWFEEVLRLSGAEY
jgi:hypothetical protein